MLTLVKRKSLRSQVLSKTDVMISYFSVISLLFLHFYIQNFHFNVTVRAEKGQYQQTNRNFIKNRATTINRIHRQPFFTLLAWLGNIII